MVNDPGVPSSSSSLTRRRTVSSRYLQAVSNGRRDYRNKFTTGRQNANVEASKDQHQHDDDDHDHGHEQRQSQPHFHHQQQQSEQQHVESQQTPTRKKALNESFYSGVTAPTAALDISSSWSSKGTPSRSDTTASRRSEEHHRTRQQQQHHHHYHHSQRRIDDHLFLAKPDGPLGMEDDCSSIESSASQKQNKAAHLSLEMDEVSDLLPDTPGRHSGMETSMPFQQATTTTTSTSTSIPSNVPSNNRLPSPSRLIERAKEHMAKRRFHTAGSGTRPSGKIFACSTGGTTLFPKTTKVDNVTTTKVINSSTQPLEVPPSPYAMRRARPLRGEAQTRHRAMSTQERWQSQPMEDDLQLGTDSEAGTPTEIITNRATDLLYRNHDSSSEAGAPTEVMTNRSMDVIKRLPSNYVTDPPLVHRWTDKITSKEFMDRSLFDDTSTFDESTTLSPENPYSKALMKGGSSSFSTTNEKITLPIANSPPKPMFGGRPVGKQAKAVLRQRSLRLRARHTQDRAVEAKTSNPMHFYMPESPIPQPRTPQEASSGEITSSVSTTDKLLLPGSSTKKRMTTFVRYNSRKTPNAHEVFQRRYSGDEASDASTISTLDKEENRELLDNPIQPLFSLDRLDISKDTQSPLRKHQNGHLHDNSVVPSKSEQYIGTHQHQHLNDKPRISSQQNAPASANRFKVKRDSPDPIFCPGPSMSFSSVGMESGSTRPQEGQDTKFGRSAIVPWPQSRRVDSESYDEEVVNIMKQQQSFKNHPTFHSSVRDKIHDFNRIPPDQWNSVKSHALLPPSHPSLKLRQKGIGAIVDEKKEDLNTRSSDDDDCISVKSLKEKFESQHSKSNQRHFSLSHESGNGVQSLREKFDQTSYDIDDDDTVSVKDLRGKFEIGEFAEIEDDDDDDDDDDRSVRSLREKFENPVKIEKGAAVSNLRQLFETKKANDRFGARSKVKTVFEPLATPDKTNTLQNSRSTSCNNNTSLALPTNDDTASARMVQDNYLTEGNSFSHSGNYRVSKQDACKESVAEVGISDGNEFDVDDAQSTNSSRVRGPKETHFLSTPAMLLEYTAVDDKLQHVDKASTKEFKPKPLSMHQRLNRWAQRYDEEAKADRQISVDQSMMTPQKEKLEHSQPTPSTLRALPKLKGVMNDTVCYKTEAFEPNILPPASPKNNDDSGSVQACMGLDDDTTSDTDKGSVQATMLRHNACGKSFGTEDDGVTLDASLADVSVLTSPTLRRSKESDEMTAAEYLLDAKMEDIPDEKPKVLYTLGNSKLTTTNCNSEFIQENNDVHDSKSVDSLEEVMSPNQKTLEMSGTEEIQKKKVMDSGWNLELVSKSFSYDGSLDKSISCSQSNDSFRNTQWPSFDDTAWLDFSNEANQSNVYNKEQIASSIDLSSIRDREALKTLQGQEGNLNYTPLGIHPRTDYDVVIEDDESLHYSVDSASNHVSATQVGSYDGQISSPSELTKHQMPSSESMGFGGERNYDGRTWKESQLNRESRETQIPSQSCSIAVKDGFFNRTKPTERQGQKLVSNQFSHYTTSMAPPVTENSSTKSRSERSGSRSSHRSKSSRNTASGSAGLLSFVSRLRTVKASRLLRKTAVKNSTTHTPLVEDKEESASKRNRVTNFPGSKKKMNKSKHDFTSLSSPSHFLSPPNKPTTTKHRSDPPGKRSRATLAFDISSISPNSFDDNSQPVRQKYYPKQNLDFAMKSQSVNRLDAHKQEKNREARQTSHQSGSLIRIPPPPSTHFHGNRSKLNDAGLSAHTNDLRYLVGAPPPPPPPRTTSSSHTQQTNHDDFAYSKRIGNREESSARNINIRELVGTPPPPPPVRVRPSRDRSALTYANEIVKRYSTPTSSASPGKPRSFRSKYYSQAQPGSNYDDASQYYS